MPRKADGAIRYRASDPNCPWCGGTGHIEGVEEQLWGGRTDCAHVWEETPPRRERSATDKGKTSNIGNRGASYDALGGRFCLQCGAWSGHLGLEPTPDLYVSHLLMVFREVWRVLRDDGVAWLEVGDSYVTHPAGLIGEARWKASTLANRDHTGAEQAGSVDKRQGELREKNLALVPFRVALALQADGWIVRQDNIWVRPNPMPESVHDRTTRAHSYVFQLVKQPRYYYDAEAVREAWTDTTPSDVNRALHGSPNYQWKGAGTEGLKLANPRPVGDPRLGRNLRSVWTIPTAAYKGAHFATFPEALAERCILAATSERGACPQCGTPWERTTDHANLIAVWTPTCRCYPDPCDRCGTAWVQKTIQRRVSTMNIRVRDAKKGILGQKSGLGGIVADATQEEIDAYGTVDRASEESYRMEETEVRFPGCNCRAPVPCMVLDPFAGSGTTLATAKRLGRRSVGVELNPLYVDLIRQRLAETRTEAVHYPGQRRLDLFVEAPT